MSVEAGAEPSGAALADAAMLQRFREARRLPSGSALLGLEVLALSQADRTIETRFDARADRFANPMGHVQGGFLCAMLDECMSLACVVAAGIGHVAPTLEMKTSFLRPAPPGWIRGIGRIVRWGRTVAFTEGELFDSEGRLVAKASGTAMPTPLRAFAARERRA